MKFVGSASGHSPLRKRQHQGRVTVRLLTVRIACHLGISKKRRCISYKSPDPCGRRRLSKSCFQNLTPLRDGGRSTLRHLYFTAWKRWVLNAAGTASAHIKVVTLFENWLTCRMRTRVVRHIGKEIGFSLLQTIIWHRPKNSNKIGVFGVSR